MSTLCTLEPTALHGPKNNSNITAGCNLWQLPTAPLQSYTDPLTFVHVLQQIGRAHV